jgi:hypothetical protein
MARLDRSSPGAGPPVSADLPGRADPPGRAGRLVWFAGIYLASLAGFAALVYGLRTLVR